MQPVVTIVIPVGPGHARYLPTALASVAQQQTPARVIVVNDTREPLFDPAPSYPLTLLTTDGGQGSGAARNMGIREASTPWLCFLDADDWLVPGGLDWLIRQAAHRDDAAYIYGGFWNDVDGVMEYKRPAAYQQGHFAHYNPHPVTCLVATEDARAVGGFPEDSRWEDWIFFLRLAMNGRCGAVLDAPVFVYRRHTGMNFKQDREGGQALMDAVTAPYRDAEGRIAFMGCCGQNETAHAAARRVAAQLDPLPSSGIVRVEYIGPNAGAITMKYNGHPYRGGRLGSHRWADMPEADADLAIESGLWRKVLRAPEQKEPPKEPSGDDETAAQLDEAAAVLHEAGEPSDVVKVKRGKK